MLVFLKRHIISLILLITSAIIGLVIYVKTLPSDVWLVEYEYRTDQFQNIPKFAQADTLFLYTGIVCRNETGSIADTLVQEGIRRHDLKVELQRPTKRRIEYIGEELLTSEYTTVINHRFRGTRKDKRVILYWILFGFLGGMIVEFILAMIKKPGTN